MCGPSETYSQREDRLKREARERADQQAAANKARVDAKAKAAAPAVAKPTAVSKHPGSTATGAKVNRINFLKSFFTNKLKPLSTSDIASKYEAGGIKVSLVTLKRDLAELVAAGTIKSVHVGEFVKA